MPSIILLLFVCMLGLISAAPMHPAIPVFEPPARIMDYSSALEALVNSPRNPKVIDVDTASSKTPPLSGHKRTKDDEYLDRLQVLVDSNESSVKRIPIPDEGLFGSVSNGMNRNDHYQGRVAPSVRETGGMVTITRGKRREDLSALALYHIEHARNGDQQSLLFLGTMFFDGAGGFPKDPAAGLDYYWNVMRKSYHGRELVARDAEVVKRIDQAAETSRAAQFMRALLYDQTPGKTDEAQKMYLKAIQIDQLLQNSPEPAIIFGSTRNSAHERRPTNERFMNLPKIAKPARMKATSEESSNQRDYSREVAIYKKMADNGDPRAQIELGEISSTERPRSTRIKERL